MIIMDLNKVDYYIPDSIWSSFGINTQEEYIERYVIRSKFHADVHDDIIKSYETAEYLMAHSYYHWPMYDEAKKKLLGIFEMAVKLRNAELANDLTFKDKKGKIHQKKLNRLIDDLGNFGYPEGYIKELHWIREHRNSEAHPERHGFGGAILMRNFYLIINSINELFMHPDKVLEPIEKYHLLVKKHADSLEGLYVVPFEGQSILAYNPVILRCWKIKEKWVTALYFQYVFQDTKVFIESHIDPKPLLFILSDINFAKEEIKALNIENSEKITFQKTLSPENIEHYNKHLAELQQTNDMDRKSYNFIQQRDVNHAIEVSIYQ